MLADKYALESLRKSTLRYISHNHSTIRADSKAKDSLANLAEKPILLAEVMTADV